MNTKLFSAHWTPLLCVLVLSAPISAQQMIFPGETWQTATPESVLVDSAKLQRAVELLDVSADSIEEMVIVKNGRVIWQGNNVSHAQPVHSVTKSFTSTVMGLLVDDGIITPDTG